MRLLHLCLLLGLTLALAPAVWADEEDEGGETKEWKSHNLRWTLPDSEDWTFAEPDPQSKAAGYFAMVKHASNSIQATFYVSVRPTGGLTLAERGDEMLSNARASMQEVTKAEKNAAVLSGLPGTSIEVTGTVSGVKAYIQSHAIVYKDKFYTLYVRVWYGHQNTYEDEIAEVRDGLRLIEGAGKTATPDDDEGNEGEGDEGGTKPESGDGDAARTPDSWPENGPKKEGDKITFPSQNLVWTLTDSAFSITKVIADETAKSGNFLELEMREGPNHCAVTLLIQDRPPGFDIRSFADDPETLNRIAERMETRIPGGAKIEKDLDIGNSTGVRLTVAGKVKDTYATIIETAVALDVKLYRWVAVVRGERDCHLHFIKPIDEILAGVHFPKTTETVAGPIAGPVAAHVVERGKRKGKHFNLLAPGVKVRKPKNMAQIDEGLQDEEIRFALETRTEEGDAYLYCDLRVYEKAKMTEQGRKLIHLLDERAQQWLADAGSGAKLSSTGADEPPKKSGFWASAKGLVYEFTAELNGHPFVEKGWIVTKGKRVFFIRFQFGGKDAEDKLESTFKSIEKNWQWK